METGRCDFGLFLLFLVISESLGPVLLGRYIVFLGQIRSGSIFSDVQLCTIWPDISALFSDQYDFPDLCFDWLEYVKQPIISSL